MNTRIYLPVLLLLTACQSAPPTAPAPDSSAAGKALIDTYFRHFNAHEWDQMAAMYSDTAQMKDPTLGPGIHPMTPAQIAAKYKEMQTMIPDVRDSVVSTHAAGEYFTVEFISSGTGPDGQPFTLPICTIFRIEKDKITQDYTYFDDFCMPAEGKFDAVMPVSVD